MNDRDWKDVALTVGMVVCLLLYVVLTVTGWF